MTDDEPGLAGEAGGVRLVELYIHLARRDIDYHKSFFSCRGDETIVECDHFQGCGPTLRSQEGGCKLQRISGTQRVHAKKPCRRFSDGVARIDLVPASGQSPQLLKSERDRLRAERLVAFEAGQG